MKKIVYIITILVLFSSCASSKGIEGYHTFYKKHKSDENVVSFGLPTGLMSLFLNNDEDKELKEFLKNIDDLRFFIAEDSNKSLLPELNKYLPEEHYKDIMIIKDGGDKVIFKARENGDAISEIIMLVEEDSSFVVMSVEGEFTYDDIKNFAKSVDVNKVVDAED